MNLLLRDSSPRDLYNRIFNGTEAGESTRYHYVLVVFDEKLTDSLKNSMTKKSCSQHGSIQLFTGEWLRKNGNWELALAGAKIDFLPKDKWSQWIKYAITMESITHIKSLLGLEFKVKHWCSTLTPHQFKIFNTLGNRTKMRNYQWKWKWIS